jgi:hypothetical protein
MRLGCTNHCQYILDGQVGSEPRRKGRREIGREGEGLIERAAKELKEFKN